MINIQSLIWACVNSITIGLSLIGLCFCQLCVEIGLIPDNLPNYLKSLQMLSLWQGSYVTVGAALSDCLQNNLKNYSQLFKDINNGNRNRWLDFDSDLSHRLDTGIDFYHCTYKQYWKRWAMSEICTLLFKFSCLTLIPVSIVMMTLQIAVSL